jgi:transcriptional regulator with XRE-family HTH domain
MYFQVLQLRLIAILKGRVRSGELTERRLARLTGISQPHIHNVLKGARILSPEIADQILETLRISVFDLFHAHELAGIGRAGGSLAVRYEEVPVLDGRIGPGYPLPLRESPIERYPFPHSQLAAVPNPIVGRLGADQAMRGWFGSDDLVLLDRSPDRRRNIEPGGLYVAAQGNSAVIRHVRIEGANILAGANFSAGLQLWNCISLSGEDILDVVLAKVVWIGRDMERNRSAGETPEETGAAHRSAGRKR